MQRTDARTAVTGLPWYHTIDLGHGLVTPGLYDHRPHLAAYGLPADLSGKTALDIGTASGYFAFELERRGARVTATDLPGWFDHDFGPTHASDQTAAEGAVYLREPFDLAQRLLGTRVHRLPLNVYDLDPERIGRFDLTFCSGLLIHLTDPIRALWRIASVTREKAIIATVIGRHDAAAPLAEYVGHHRGESWWVPTRACLERLVAGAGFAGVEWRGSFDLNYRDGRPGQRYGVLHAYTTAEGWTPATRSSAALLADDQATLDEALARQAAELERLRALVAGYERGRFIRLMHWLRRR